MEKNQISTYIYNAIVILCITCGVIYTASRFMYFGGGVVTDNARVCQNIVPQNCRVQGFIREVRFCEFQEVRKGDTLVVIEDAEFRLRLALILPVPNAGRRVRQVVSIPQRPV